MNQQRYAVRVVNSRALWYARTDDNRIIIEEIINYHLENALRIRV